MCKQTKRRTTRILTQHILFGARLVLADKRETHSTLLTYYNKRLHNYQPLATRYTLNNHQLFFFNVALTEPLHNCNQLDGFKITFINIVANNNIPFLQWRRN